MLNPSKGIALSKTQREISLKTGAAGLTAESFKTDAHGNLTITNAELSHLIQQNVSAALKNKGSEAAISVGVVVGD